MVEYTDTLIVSEFRSGKSIDRIAQDMLLAEKGRGNKVNKLNCKQKAETAILNYLILNNRCKKRVIG
ncbi:hypothetical protein [Ruminiclostridium papyrosolvens]|uniref:Uncharacterized protein n=1 Tax=Ruminiclostridium papyrosolvens C7 TaxID=1330534 RepID=U4QXR3_9FIRM|nr:hypothetical protein [Ruminiclostridium papyrosolvens]EPR07790.1 hypothetical protein L323_20030 [Ruminiclostridium papyrosolvens C7]